MFAHESKVVFTAKLPLLYQQVSTAVASLTVKFTSSVVTEVLVLFVGLTIDIAGPEESTPNE